MGRFDEIVLDLEVIEKELDRKIVIGLDAAYARGGDDDPCRTL
jgi:hypothetical protein